MPAFRLIATAVAALVPLWAGNLPAIAVNSAKRSRSLPDVPTVADSGFPGFEAGSWFGLFAPKGVARDSGATLN